MDHPEGMLGSVVVAAVENGLVVENYLRNFSTDIMAGPEFKDGYVIMGESPGLGIEWNEELIKREGETF